MASLAACGGSGASRLGAGAVAPVLRARSRNTSCSGPRRVVVVRATRCFSHLTRSDLVTPAYPLHPNLSVDDRAPPPQPPAFLALACPASAKNWGQQIKFAVAAGAYTRPLFSST
jgi:hypothetical protein